jgi:phosphohistidine phosphatase
MAGTHELYLIRHGIAAERGPQYPDDTKRPLTQQGIARLRRGADGLIQLDVAFDIIISSPLTRAKQTADVIASALPGKPTVVYTDALAPGAPHTAIIDELAKHSRRARIALVGHEPDLGELAARLLSAKKPVELKKGSVCRIDVQSLPPAGPGRLRWLLTPRMLRKIGK